MPWNEGPDPNEFISLFFSWIEKSILSPLNITKFHIVAHSMGCLVGLSLAAKHSKNVSSVNLLAPVSYFHDLLTSPQVRRFIKLETLTKSQILWTAL